MLKLFSEERNLSNTLRSFANIFTLSLYPFLLFFLITFPPLSNFIMQNKTNKQKSITQRTVTQHGNELGVGLYPHASVMLVQNTRIQTETL